MKQSPLVLTIAGHDPGGRAGLTRDREVLESLGCRVEGVRTARTAQDPHQPLAVWPEAAAVVGERIEQALQRGSVAAVKIGMLATAEIASEVRRRLVAFEGPVVLDPVLTSSAGLCLLEENAYAALTSLAANCTLVTPNLPELERLGGQVWLDGLGTTVLVKGGHANEDMVEDCLLGPNGTTATFRHPRMRGHSPRGTGCALSSAVAGFLAQGLPLSDAVASGIAWLQEHLFRSHGD